LHQIGHEAVDALDWVVASATAREASRPIALIWPNVGVNCADSFDQPLEAPRGSGGVATRHLDDRRVTVASAQPQKDLRPEAHAFSRVRACS
jgi:hypothetical protein